MSNFIVLDAKCNKIVAEIASKQLQFFVSFINSCSVGNIELMLTIRFSMIGKHENS